MSNMKDEVLKYAVQMEKLAQQLQTKLDQGEDPLTVANELVRTSSTMTFFLGGLYSTQQANKKSFVTTVVSNPSGTQVNTKVRTNSNFYNVRDALGRFARV